MTQKALKPIKPFLNYEEQIRNLIERKGMVITDRKFAASKLEDISYFALIDGYKNLFYNPMTRKYREGTTFEDIVVLYEFDEKLRALIFQYLCHFEQKMRSLISYHFCDTYSERQLFEGIITQRKSWLTFTEKMFEMPVISKENRGQGIHIRYCICKKFEESSYEYKKRTD